MSKLNWLLKGIFERWAGRVLLKDIASLNKQNLKVFMHQGKNINVLTVILVRDSLTTVVLKIWLAFLGPNDSRATFSQINTLCVCPLKGNSQFSLELLSCSQFELNSSGQLYPVLPWFNSNRRAHHFAPQLVLTPSRRRSRTHRRAIAWSTGLGLAFVLKCCGSDPSQTYLLLAALEGKEVFLPPVECPTMVVAV